MSEHKLFAQRVGLIGIVTILNQIVKIFFVPILTKNLAIEQYGIWAMVGVTIGLIPPILKLGFPVGIVRFLSSVKDKDKIKEDFYSLFIIVFIISVTVSFLFFLFSNQLANLLFGDNVKIVYMLSIILVLESLEILLVSIFRIFNKIKLYSFFQILEIFLTFFLVSYFILLDYGIIGAIMGLLISKVIVFSGSMLYVVSEIGICVPRFINTKKYLNYGIPLIFSPISNWILNSSDRYMITILLGISFAGYYSPGYAVGSLLSIFYASIAFMLPQTLAKQYDENNIVQFKKILKYSIKYFLLFAIPATFGLSILSRPILTILSTDEIASIGYLITPYVALSYLLLGIKAIIENILVVNNKTKIIGISILIAAILNLGLNLIFIPIFGINGAAFTTLLAFTFNFIIITFYSLKYIKFDLNLVFIVKSISASLFMSILVIYLNPVTILDIFLSICLGVALYFGIILAFKGIKKEEIQFFRDLAKF